MHILHQSKHGCKEYIDRIFRCSHRLTMRDKAWHDEFKTVYEPAYAQDGLSRDDLAHSLAEFSLDMSLVLQDEAMKNLPGLQEGLSAPKAASDASKQLSALNSITTLKTAAQPPPLDDVKIKSPPKLAKPRDNPYFKTKRQALSPSKTPAHRDTQQAKQQKLSKTTFSKSSAGSSPTESVTPRTSDPSTISTTTSIATSTESSPPSDMLTLLKRELVQEMRQQLLAQEIGAQQRLEEQALQFTQLLRQLLPQSPPTGSSQPPTSEHSQSMTAQFDGGGQSS